MHRDAEQVGVLLLHRRERRSLALPLDLGEQVAQARRALELQRLGGRPHVGPQSTRERLDLAGEEESGALDRVGVLLGGRQPLDARPQAALHVPVEAGAR